MLYAIRRNEKGFPDGKAFLVMILNIFLPG